ncbi:hypothetical protein ABEB36_003394 [Hypothenemus hampei]|uniref:Uncharacterized protein n=1 Tax=Hypothenemus hampei TaxID=57062 RepID=A0ABD1FC55_HYPHA
MYLGITYEVSSVSAIHFNLNRWCGNIKTRSESIFTSSASNIFTMMRCGKNDVVHLKSRETPLAHAMYCTATAPSAFSLINSLGFSGCFKN